MRNYTVFFLVVLLFSCKVSSLSKNKNYKPQPAAATASSCSFEGKIIEMIGLVQNDPEDPCGKHPCKALVLVNEVSDCGPGVSVRVNQGDTIVMKFAYTLDNTSKIYPKMYTHYPGLKPGDVFQAKAEQRLVPGTQGEFVVYGYRIK